MPTPRRRHRSREALNNAIDRSASLGGERIVRPACDPPERLGGRAGLDAAPPERQQHDEAAGTQMFALDSLIMRIRGEYREMPGLRLTFAQACRLWQIEPHTCELVLARLLSEGFLCSTPAGAYIAIRTVGERVRPVNATIRPRTGHRHIA